ncbi:GNAT family N-acetyltransferase [Alkalihalobacillus sp. CinArs1]|uniref:GNAT family N-acetyltransferase n=1 Tax=Alkalihalobacillus sp. CinArs1 TaxID=2995314 RepID=UPI0022DDB315|nr:GNAT family N-acetyltransferase [Alkalihalobacillus sp. CinArs1]
MIRLEKMKASEFQSYLKKAIKNYAGEHVKAGNWSEEEAIDKATKEYERLLPEGEETVNNHLFTIHDEEKEVGMIWLAQRTTEKGFIFDINIREGYQGRGYGKKAMKEIEIEAKKLGLKIVKLHVFGHNQIARGLYEKLGYVETDIVMEKKI